MFNFTQLAAIFNQALQHDTPTIAFELQDGNGRFVFMLFFSEHDSPSDRHLFLYLANTNVLLSFKLYGNQEKGSFQVYPKGRDVAAIREELGIVGGAHPFHVNDLFFRLNENIPRLLPLTVSIGTLQRHRNSLIDKQKVHLFVDEASKVYLIGPRPVSVGKPREKTLRKLYLYVDADPDVIGRLIAALKSANWTVAWSDTPPKDRQSLMSMINRVPTR